MFYRLKNIEDARKTDCEMEVVLVNDNNLDVNGVVSRIWLNGKGERIAIQVEWYDMGSGYTDKGGFFANR